MNHRVYLILEFHFCFINKHNITILFNFIMVREIQLLQVSVSYLKSLFIKYTILFPGCLLHKAAKSKGSGHLCMGDPRPAVS